MDYLMFGEQKEFGEIWMSLLSSDNLTKMEMLLRLVTYFGMDSREYFYNKLFDILEQRNITKTEFNVKI